MTQYEYDTANRVTRMITGSQKDAADPTDGESTRYSYNDLGYLAKTTDPMDMSESYNSYDYVSNPLSVTDKNSKIRYN